MNIEKEELSVILKSLEKRIYDNEKWRLKSYTPLFYRRTLKERRSCFQQSFDWEYTENQRVFLIQYDEEILEWRQKVWQAIQCSLSYYSVSGKKIYGPIDIAVSPVDEMEILPTITALIEIGKNKHKDVLKRDFQVFYDPKIKQNILDEQNIPDILLTQRLFKLRDQNRADLVHRLVMSLHSIYPDKYVGLNEWLSMAEFDE